MGVRKGHNRPRMSDALGIDVGGSSVKIAALRGGLPVWTAQSRTYQNPEWDELIRVMREAVSGREGCGQAVGVCVPGIRDASGRKVTLSVNLPVLNGISISNLAEQALGRTIPNLSICGDSVAAAYDLYAARHLSGRLLGLALGTGVGAAVLDDGVPLGVDGESCGHVGQFDCSIESEFVIGPDGGAGSLEGYIGVPALVARYGPDVSATLARLGPDDPPIRALARAIRICHAIYCPDHIILTGGIGNRMSHLVDTLRTLVEKDLTRVARRGWTLACGDDDYHAARGAARLADANWR